MTPRFEVGRQPHSLQAQLNDRRVLLGIRIDPIVRTDIRSNFALASAEKRYSVVVCLYATGCVLSPW